MFHDLGYRGTWVFEGYIAAVVANDAGSVALVVPHQGAVSPTLDLVYLPANGGPPVVSVGGGIPTWMNDSGQVVGRANDSLVGEYGTGNAFIFDPKSGYMDLNKVLPANSGWSFEWRPVLAMGAS